MAVFYFLGIDNTPNFQTPTGQVEPQLIASWKKLRDHNPDSQYHALAAQLLTRIEKHHGLLTQEDRDLFEQAGLGASFDEWWRRFQLRLGR